jgi:hypothetical protein
MTNVSPASDPTLVIDTPEAVGVFDSFNALQAAFYDLRTVGFHHSDISLLGSKTAIEEKLGKAWWRSPQLEDDPHAPRAHFVSEEAMGELGGFFFLGSYIAMLALLTPASTLAASIAAIAIGGTPSAIIGTLLARRADKHHRDYYANQIEHGGILMWVRTRDDERKKLAVEIMKKHSGRDVHVHGWSA